MTSRVDRARAVKTAYEIVNRALDEQITMLRAIGHTDVSPPLEILTEAKIFIKDERARRER